MQLFICDTCGHIAFNEAPEACPSCGMKKFTQNDSVFTDSAEKSAEGARKHIPAITVKKECALIPDAGCVDVLVTVGEVIHPMEDKHHITFIDCYVDDTFVSRQQLTPGVNPGSLFHLKSAGQKVRVVENCNVHGWWTAEESLN